MGRPCKCCKPDECIDIRSDFCTPWIVEYSTFEHTIEIDIIDSSSLHISVDMNIPSGNQFTQLYCNGTPYFNSLGWFPRFTRCGVDGEDPAWKIVLSKDCFGRDVVYDPIITNPWFYEVTTSEHFYPEIIINTKKIIKLESGRYSISISGFSYSILEIVLFNKCIELNKINCGNNDNTFYYPSIEGLNGQDKTNASIINGPDSLCDPVLGGSIPIEYPQDLKDLPYFPNSYGYLLGNYTIEINIEENSFMYIDITGKSVGTGEIVLGECVCPDGNSVEATESIDYHNPESFSYIISISPLDDQDIVCKNNVKDVAYYKDLGFTCD